MVRDTCVKITRIDYAAFMDLALSRNDIVLSIMPNALRRATYLPFRWARAVGVFREGVRVGVFCSMGAPFRNDLLQKWNSLVRMVEL